MITKVKADPDYPIQAGVWVSLEDHEREVAELITAYNVRNDEVTGLMGQLAELRAALHRGVERG